MSENDGKRLAQLYRGLAGSPAGVELLKWLDDRATDLLGVAVNSKESQQRLAALDEAAGVQSVAQYIRGFLD